MRATTDQQLQILVDYIHKLWLKIYQEASGEAQKNSYLNLVHSFALRDAIFNQIERTDPIFKPILKNLYTKTRGNDYSRSPGVLHTWISQTIIDCTGLEESFVRAALLSKGAAEPLRGS